MGRKAAQRPVEEQLRDFEAESSTLPPPPKNLGNFPDELDSPSISAPLRAESPEPDATPPPEPAAEPEPPPAPAAEPDTQQAAADDDESELDQLRRERDFLRLSLQNRPASAPPAPPAPPDVTQLVSQYLGGYRVRPEDVQTILQDPEKGAEYLTAGIYAAVAAGAAMAVDRARQEFNQYQGQQQQATQLRDLFYGQHADLAPYGKLVQQFATEVHAANPNLGAEGLVRETASRVRAQLREWGVTPSRAPGSQTIQAQPRSYRPARAEMGGSGRANGRTTLSPLEKQLREFEHMTSQYR